MHAGCAEAGGQCHNRQITTGNQRATGGGCNAGDLADAGANRGVRVIVLAANGPAYCAGHDLKELTAGRTTPDKGRAYYAHSIVT